MLWLSADLHGYNAGFSLKIEVQDNTDQSLSMNQFQNVIISNSHFSDGLLFQYAIRKTFQIFFRNLI